MEISHKHILITGASRGVGRAFAMSCAEEKAQLTLVVRQEPEGLREELLAKGAKSVDFIVSDLKTFEGVQFVLDKMQDQPVDILFNNAGVLMGGLLEEQPIGDIYQMLQVNVNATIHLVRGLLPGMIQRKRGKIITNSSVSAYMHFPYTSSYAASKAAIVAFTECLKIELKGTGVTTLLLVSPSVKTRFFDEVETLYSKNFQVPKESISPTRYAEMIREAVIHDLPEVTPTGFTGLGLKVAKFAKPLFDLELSRKFKR